MRLEFNPSGPFRVSVPSLLFDGRHYQGGSAFEPPNLGAAFELWHAGLIHVVSEQAPQPPQPKPQAPKSKR